MHDDENDDGLGVPRGVLNGCAVELLIFSVPAALVLLALWAGLF